MLWMCGLSFAQEEKNELGLLLGAEFIPRATTTSNQKLSIGRGIAYSVDYARRLSSGNTALLLEFPFAAAPSHKVDSAQINATTSLATLFVTPSLRARFLNHVPASPWLSGRFGYGLYEGSRVLQNRVVNTPDTSERGDSAIRRGNRRPYPAQTAVPDRLQRRGSGLLHVKHTQLRRSSSAHTAAQCRRLGRIGCPLLAGFGEDRHY